MTVPEIILIAGTSIYTIAILSLFGWQKSYSMSYYNYNQHPIWKYAFSLFCWSIAYPALIIGATPLLFVAFIFIGIVGVAAAFLDDKTVYWLHMIGAYGGIIFAQLSIAIDFKQYYVNAAFIVLSLLVILFKDNLPKWKDKKGNLHSTHFFWIELLAIISIWKVLIF